ncbi:MAG TPA: LamG domain-containing protein [Candidatus Dojkabacteria bacterium]|nr:LamG domain-containing protein [Candidatus Dojkabacteria bacterium]
MSIFFTLFVRISFAQACGQVSQSYVDRCDVNCNAVYSTQSWSCFISGSSCVANYSNYSCITVSHTDPVTGQISYSCEHHANNNVQISCGGGGGGGGGGNCNPKDLSCCRCAQTQCTPVCPAGTTITNNGLPVKTIANCSYHNGGCNKNGGCISIGKDANCYYDDPDTAPVSSIITATSGTSPLNCTTTSSYSGKQTNNKLTIKTTFVDTNSNNSPIGLISWFGLTTPSAITNISNAGGTPKLVSNNSFGILVKKNPATGTWSDLYIPGFAPVGASLQFSWIKAGTIGNGLRAEIIGQIGKKLAAISNVKINTVTSAGIITGNYDAEVLPNAANLISHWQFNQTNQTNTGVPTGTCAAGCNANLNSFPSPVGPDVSATSGWTQKSELWGGSSLNFDGIDDYASFPAAGTLTTQFNLASALSISGWAKASTMPGAGKRATILNAYNTNGVSPITGLRLSLYDGNKVEFQASDSGTSPVNSVTAVISSPNEWHYYVGVVDFPTKKMYLYVDGNLAASITGVFPQPALKYVAGGIPKSVDSIGATMVYNGVLSKPADFFAGTIDSVALFKRAMTPIEIATIFNNYLYSSIALTYDIEFYNELSGIASYEKVTDGAYKVYAAGMTSATLLTGQTAFNTGENWADLNLNQTVDLTDPLNDSLTTSSGPANTINIAWKFSDAKSPIYRVNGDAAINSGVANGTIDDLTSGVTNYTLGSGSNNFTGSHLWTLGAGAALTLSRTENIDLKNNNASIIYTLNAFDQACNVTTVQKTLGTTVAADPWILTKAGTVYTAGGSIFQAQAFASHTVFGPESYWSAPSNIYQDEADITTELLESNGAFTALINAVKLGSATISNYTDVNNKHGYWFNKISSTLDAKKLSNSANYVVVTQASNYTLPSKVTSVTDGTNVCVNTKDCIVKVNGTLTVPSNFSCDARATFLVTGDITVNPNVTNAGASYGCIYVASNNITIGAGTYQSASSTYPKFDELDGYYIADNALLIPLADASQSIKDGLKVTGGLIAFGSNTTSAFVFGRDLAAFNNNYPALVIHNDNRFLTIGSEMLGSMQDLYKQEVGFKPL